jgi:hypothetical protein
LVSNRQLADVRVDLAGEVGLLGHRDHAGDPAAEFGDEHRVPGLGGGIQ